MDSQLARKIIKEIRKYSGIGCAITDTRGNIYAKTQNFLAGNNKHINISSSLLENNPPGHRYYISFNQDPALSLSFTKVVDSIVRVIVNQYYSLRSLAEVDQRADYLAYDYLVAGLIKGHEYFAMAEGTGLRRRMNLCAILLEISDPNYTLQNKREVKEGERYEIINRTRRNIEDTFHNFYTKHPFARANYLGGQRFLVWKDMGSNAADYIDDFKRTLPNLHYNLQDALRTQISMGVGSYKVGAEHMRESYQEAEMAVRFGKQNSGPNKVYSHDDLWAIAPIYSEASDSNLNFNDKVIKTIKEQAGLLKTLEKFVDNELSLTKTAKELHIHRNTLVYRLDKIYEITNLDPKIFNDAFELKIALIMERRRVH